MKKFLSVLVVVAMLVVGFLVLNDKPRVSVVNAEPSTYGVQNAKNLVQDIFVAKRDGNKQVIETELSTYGYPVLVIEKGVEVEWVMIVDDQNLTSCNNAFSIPDLQLQVELFEGENKIEFTANEVGVVDYRCWMGMIRSNIVVVESLDDVDLTAIKQQLANQPRSGSGGCCDK